MRMSTAEIKKYLKECVGDGKECTTPDFCQYIKKRSEKEFTKGQIAGAIAQLTEKGELVKIERGLYGGLNETGIGDKYVKKSVGNSQFTNEIAICLENSTNELNQIVEKANILSMSKEEFALLIEIKNLKEKIEQISLKCK